MIISTSSEHCRQIAAALDAGKHVFSEKPLGVDLEQCLQAQAAVERHPELTFMLGFMRRYDPSYAYAKQQVDAGVIGTPYLVKATGLDPEAVVEDIQVHTETAAAEDWSARVTESYCDGSKILMTVEVSGGDRYVLAPTYVEPQSSIGEIGLSGEQTLEDYAREQGKELLFVGASLMQNEGLGIFTEAQNNRSPSPTEMVILVESDRSNADPVESAVCWVHAWMADGTRKNLEIPFNLGAAPIQGEEVYVPIDPDAIPGITVGNATVTKTSLGVTVRYQETITDQEAAYSILKRESPELPGLMGGFVEDGSREIILTMGQGEIPGKLTIRYYDDDKAYIGEIDFRKAI